MRIYCFFIWRNLNPFHPRIIWAKIGWNWLSVSGEEDFLISSMYFHYFVIISPWKRVGPFICTILNPLHHRMHCDKFGWNWLSGSGKEDFKTSSMYFGYFVIISPWILNPPSSKDALCQVWSKLAQKFFKRFLNFINVFSLFCNYMYLSMEKGGVWSKLARWFWARFLNFINVFSLFLLLSPLGKGWGPSFVQTWIPFTQGYFVPSLVEISPVVLEKMKMWRVYIQTDGQTDGWTDGWTKRQTTDSRWSEKLTWAFSSVELKILLDNFFDFSMKTLHVCVSCSFIIHIKFKSKKSRCLHITIPYT